ncbi:MAG: PilZ domain-containing protein [Methyloprofundus sp.]|nr:PilZ domain-containing protein [Methyloprofundus sp.]MDT8425968.1 PilZ domain-containing protein [Methyloprofundus sp.]
MTNSRQNYRKNLNLQGFMFIGGAEHAMQVQNLSITGMLASIHTSLIIQDVRDVFLLLKQSNLVDIFIEKLNLAGEAEISRVEMDGQHILIGLEFKQISYDADSSLYKRKAYRKSITAPGQALIAKNVYEFMTRNVSVEGLMIRIPEHVPVQESMLIEFKFDKLHLHGEAKIAWFEHDDNEGTLLGLEYQHMEKIEIKGIPQFYHREA